MLKAKLNKDGRITIPKDVRNALGWEPGDRMELTDTPEGIFARRVEAAKDSTDQRKPRK